MSIIVFDAEFVTHDVVFTVVVIDIDDAKSAISGRNFQPVEQMPSWPSKVIRSTVQDESVACPVELVVPATNALVIAKEQVLVLMDHSQPQVTIHSYDEFG